MRLCKKTTDTQSDVVFTERGDCVTFDILVLAIGSGVLVPRQHPRTRREGRLMISRKESQASQYAMEKRETGVGGAVLGLEAADTVQWLKLFLQVSLIERNR
jgi:NAD(P)H-nitrite reductase large subunit